MTIKYLKGDYDKENYVEGVEMGAKPKLIILHIRISVERYLVVAVACTVLFICHLQTTI